MSLIAKVIRISHAKFHCNRPKNSTRYSRLCESHIGTHCRPMHVVSIRF